MTSPLSSSRAVQAQEVRPFQASCAANSTRPALQGGADGHRSVPSPEAGRAKMDGDSHPGRAAQAETVRANSGQAVTYFGPRRRLKDAVLAHYDQHRNCTSSDIAAALSCDAGY